MVVAAEWSTCGGAWVWRELGGGAFYWVGAWWGFVGCCSWLGGWDRRRLLLVLLHAVGKGLVGVLPVVSVGVPLGLRLAPTLFALAFAFVLAFALTFALAFSFAFGSVVVVGCPLVLPLLLLLGVVVEYVLPPEVVSLEFVKCLWECHAFVPVFVKYVIESGPSGSFGESEAAHGRWVVLAVGDGVPIQPVIVFI